MVWLLCVIAFALGFVGRVSAQEWVARDIGVGIGGSSVFDAQRWGWSVQGRGSGLLSVNDGFHFCALSLPAGDVEIVAQVLWPWSCGSDGAMGGLMIRQSDAMSSPFGGIFATEGQEVYGISRTAAGVPSFGSELGGYVNSVWLRVVKYGDYVIGYRSENGLEWKRCAAVWNPMSGSFSAGFAVSSGTNTEAGTDFLCVSVSSPHVVFGALPQPWIAENIGASVTPSFRYRRRQLPWIVGNTGVSVTSVTSGTASYDAEDGGAFLVSGTGMVLGGTADSFGFMHRSWSGEGTATVRILDVPDAGAKAGLVFRESTVAGARGMNFYVTGSDEVVLSARATTGGATVVCGSAAFAAPCWLELVRSGSNWNASVSADGENWTLVASATLNFQAKMEAGLASVSGSLNRVMTPMFDRFEMEGVDTNGNGLPDAWEQEMFGDLNHAANVDSDGDGLTNYEEFLLGTNPTLADSNGDGVPDGAAVAQGRNPLTSDTVADTNGMVNLQIFTPLR